LAQHALEVLLAFSAAFAALSAFSRSRLSASSCARLLACAFSRSSRAFSAAFAFSSAISASRTSGLGGGGSTFGSGFGITGCGGGATAAGAACSGTAAHNSAVTPAGSLDRQLTPNAIAISRPTCTTSASIAPRPMPPGRRGRSGSIAEAVMSPA
jgi:hypothetical protein